MAPPALYPVPSNWALGIGKGSIIITLALSATSPKPVFPALRVVFCSFSSVIPQSPLNPAVYSCTCLIHKAGALREGKSYGRKYGWPILALLCAYFWYWFLTVSKTIAIERGRAEWCLCSFGSIQEMKEKKKNISTFTSLSCVCWEQAHGLVHMQSSEDNWLEWVLSSDYELWRTIFRSSGLAASSLTSCAISPALLQF